MFKETNHWISTQPELLPDFIIGGAMKSGTSTLHQILKQHPDIYLPEKEVHFFNIDDERQHPDFCYYDKKNDHWTRQSMEIYPQELWTWHQNFYKGQEGKIKGEDSTTYLASPTAAERIARQEKKIKLIFLLRQPSERAYSHYWHIFNRCKVIDYFEETIKDKSDNIIYRSLYLEQLRSYLEVIPREQIKIVLFEDFIKNRSETINDICLFLNINPAEIPHEALGIHANKSLRPANIEGRLAFNKSHQEIFKSHYATSLPRPFKASVSIAAKVSLKMQEISNPFTEDLPAMAANTKEELDCFFKKHLAGLDELAEMDIMQRWFS